MKRATRAMRDAVALFAALFILAPLAAVSAQAAPPAASSAASQDNSSDESAFGSETVTESKNQEAAPAAEFLKYDQVRVGGSIKGSVGWSPTWSPAWDGSARLFRPTSDYLVPDLESRVTITAKPLSDFGVNADFRAQWPYSTDYNSYTPATGTSPGTSTPFTVQDISVWAFYSKFSWQDKIYFTFGKQPLSWGVSKSAFQPADDIFAVTTAIDITNPGAEREGPVSLKMQIPVPHTMTNFYVFAGLPSVTTPTTLNPFFVSASSTASSGSTNLSPADAFVAGKAEFNTGNTEYAAGAYYSYNDHARVLAMATTGTGDINFFGEAVLKYGSERTFLEPSVAAPAGYTVELHPDTLFFTGTGGAYYMNADSHITVTAQYYYNGEGQPKVGVVNAINYYIVQSATPIPGTQFAFDRIRFGYHYGFVSFSKGEFLQKDLTAAVYAIANLSDGSGLVSPSITWKLFDYMSVQLGASFSFGAPGTEFIFYGPTTNISQASPGNTKPAAALNLTVTMGTGDF